ncbi:hypothetical protein IJ670_02705, partial [bacterium]|nr:hypothetical protein [bacterium]
KEIIDKLRTINSTEKQTSKKYDFFKILKDKITRKDVEINIAQLKSNLEELKQAPESDKIKNIIENYIKIIEEFQKNSVQTIDTTAKKWLVADLYGGVTKIAQTLYTILSAPAQLVNYGINKVFFDKSEKELKKVADNIILKSDTKKYLISKYEDEVKELQRFFEKYKDNPSKFEKISKIIEKRTRNFETATETGALANFSRTLVTLISTYFFVNDYSNRVLIESEGKNTQEAKEVRNERIAHKISNFIINGTLMNLFNSFFKGPLNNSIVAATGIAAMTETCNEFLIRKSICQPIGEMKSRQAIIDFEEKNLKRKGIMGAWTRLFKKLTGKKSLTQKAGIKTNNTNQA